jgi:sortase A
MNAPTANQPRAAASARRRAAASRRGRALRRLGRDLGAVLILAGLLLAIDAGITLVWQEPVTAVIALIKRGEIDRRFVQRPPDALARVALAKLPSAAQRIAYLARRMQREVPTGAAIGTLVIPRLGARWTVVQGTDETSLEEGPGHYPETAFPGLGRTVGIAGHRTTYLAPFRNINELRPGDRIELEMPYGHFAYAVQYTRIVAPTALWVVRNVGYERLVLSACNPLYSAAQRIVVFARLRAVTPTAQSAVPAPPGRLSPVAPGLPGSGSEAG